MIHHINKRKNKNHMILSVDAENGFEKVLTQQNIIRGNIPQHNKTRMKTPYLISS